MTLLERAKDNMVLTFVKLKFVTSIPIHSGYSFYCLIHFS